MQGAPQDPFCQVITRTKNVIKDTPKNVTRIGVYDIFLLKLYYKQNPHNRKARPKWHYQDTLTKLVIYSQQARQALQVVSLALSQCLIRLLEFL